MKKQKKEPFKVGDIIYSREGKEYKILGLCEGLMAIQDTQGKGKNWQLNCSFPLEWRERDETFWLFSRNDEKYRKAI